MKRTCNCGKEYEYVSKSETQQQINTIMNRTGEMTHEESLKLEELKKKLNFEISCVPNICPECVKTKENEERLKITDEDVEISENALFESMGIRPIHYAATLENYECRTQEDKNNLSFCRRFVKSTSGILVLIGNNGTGKSHLASAMVKETGGVLYKMIEIGMFIRRAFKVDSGIQEEDQLKILSRKKFLVIEEAEKSKGTANEINWLSYIIDERYSRKLRTVIVLNAHMKDTHTDGKVCEKCFESIMTPDILDRIYHIGAILNFTGESYRKILRGK